MRSEVLLWPLLDFISEHVRRKVSLDQLYADEYAVDDKEVARLQKFFTDLVLKT